MVWLNLVVQFVVITALFVHVLMVFSLGGDQANGELLRVFSGCFSPNSKLDENRIFEKNNNGTLDSK